MAKEKDIKAKKKTTKVKDIPFEEDFATRKLEIISPDEVDKKEKKEVKKEVVKEVKKETPKVKKEKKSGFLGTIVIFLLLVAITAGIIYWYKEVYLKDTGVVNEVVNKKLGYSFVTYKSDKQLNLLNDTYLIEYEDDTLYRVLDKNGKLLFDDEIVFNNIYMDLNDNLYVITDEGTELGNLLSLYTLENEKFVLVKDYSELGYDFRIITYETNGKTYLYGISKVAHRAQDTENLSSLLLIGTEEEIKLDKGIYFGNVNIDTFTTLSERYLPVNNQDKVGLYDLQEKKLIINYNYDKLELVDEKDDVLVVKKNGKEALINLKLKKLIDYKYEYIYYNEGYVIVGKDNKLGILNSEYKSIVDLLIPCDYGMFNIVIDSYKIGDNIVLTITDINGIEAYNTYIVNVNDKTITNVKEEFINEDEFSYTVSTDNKIYTIYDKELVRVGTIDLNNYDFDNQVIIKKIGTNYVLSDGIYFNEELEQVETIKEYTMKKDTYGLKVSSENVVSVLIEDKVIGTYDYVYPNEMYNEMEDGTFYYISDDSYITIKKVNE